jgi:purine nucleosidase
VAPVPLIVDVDTGIDDALALLYAVASNEVELVAVTAVAGNVDADRAARNSLAVLELAGIGDVEVAAGGGGHPGPVGRHGPTGLGHGTLPAPSRAVASRSAAALIAAEARARSGELLLVATGPLTNVAEALTIAPELPRLLRTLTIGGGAYASARAETNVRNDPAAARAVFDAFTGAPTLPVCVGLDVTERARITTEDIAWLREARGDDAIARFVADAVSFAIERYEREGGGVGAPLLDPLTLAIAIDEGLALLEPMHVAVDNRGVTTIDPTPAHNARVATGVNGKAFVARFLEWLASLPTRPARPR